MYLIAGYKNAYVKISLNMTKKIKNNQAALIYIGVILAVLSPIVYFGIIELTLITCPDETYSKCSFSYSLGGYYLALLLSFLFVLSGLAFIVAGIIKLISANRRDSTK
jgi:uncharacterized membrane protein